MLITSECIVLIGGLSIVNTVDNYESLAEYNLCGDFFCDKIERSIFNGEFAILL